MSDERITVKCDGGGGMGLITLVIFLFTLFNLQSPGCVIKVNETFYNISVGLQAKP